MNVSENCKTPNPLPTPMETLVRGAIPIVPDATILLAAFNEIVLEDTVTFPGVPELLTPLT